MRSRGGANCDLWLLMTKSSPSKLLSAPPHLKRPTICHEFSRITEEKEEEDEDEEAEEEDDDDEDDRRRGGRGEEGEEGEEEGEEGEEEGEDDEKEDEEDEEDEEEDEEEQDEEDEEQEEQDEEIMPTHRWQIVGRARAAPKDVLQRLPGMAHRLRHGRGEWKAKGRQ